MSLPSSGRGRAFLLARLEYERSNNQPTSRPGSSVPTEGLDLPKRCRGRARAFHLATLKFERSNNKPTSRPGSICASCEAELQFEDAVEEPQSTLQVFQETPHLSNTQPSTITEQSSVSQKVSALMLWFSQPVPINTAEELKEELNRPIHNMDKIIDNISDGMALQTKCIHYLAMIKYLIEKDGTEGLKLCDEIIHAIREQETEIFLALKHIYYVLIVHLKLAMSINLTKEDIDVCNKPDPSDMGLRYVKASYYSMFGIEECKKALDYLKTICEGESSTLDPRNVELAFLKARILGKLKYYEQWGSTLWTEELHVLQALVKHETLQTESQMLLASFYRKFAYRSILEAEDEIPTKFYDSPFFQFVLKQTFRAREIHESLVPVFDQVRDDVKLDCYAWLIEELMQMPRRESSSYIEIIDDLVEKGMKDTSSKSAYFHRMVARHLENQNEVVQASLHIDLARLWGCPQAMLEQLAMLLREKSLKKKDVVRQLQSEPNASLQLAYFRLMVSREPQLGVDIIGSFMENIPNGIAPLVFTPVFHQLVEPINLCKLAQTACEQLEIPCPPSLQSTPCNDTYVNTIEGVRAESIRLKNNSTMFLKSHPYKRPKRKARATSQGQVMDVQALRDRYERHGDVDDDYVNPFRRDKF